MFYDRFLALCKEKGVKPTNACVEAGLSRGLAAKWKSTGTEKPSADALEKLSDYFDMSIDAILGKEKAPTPEGGRPVNIVTIAGRDGSYVERRLTDGQTKVLKMFIDELPDANEDYL